MFEDIIGGAEKKKDDIADVVVGDGIVTCPVCGSDDITKGYPIYLPNNSTDQYCECKSCSTTWSLVHEHNNSKYSFKVHKK